MMQLFSGGSPEGRQAVIAQEPVGKMGTPEEIAPMVVRLCSASASFVVGSAMVVDGGQTVKLLPPLLRSSWRMTARECLQTCRSSVTVLKDDYDLFFGMISFSAFTLQITVTSVTPCLSDN
jgi:hypothetical protein